MVRSFFFFLGGGGSGGGCQAEHLKANHCFRWGYLGFQIKKFFLIKSFDLFFAFVIVPIIYIICIYIIL